MVDFNMKFLKMMLKKQIAVPLWAFTFEQKRNESKRKLKTYI